MNTIKIVLFNLAGSFSPTSCDIGFDTPDSSPIALEDSEKGELKLFPPPRHISEKPPVGRSVKLQAAIVGSPVQDFFVAAPWLPTQAAATGEGNTHWVSPFWNAVKETGRGHTLEWTIHSWVVGLQTTPKPQGEDNKYDIKPKPPPTKIVLSVPYLVNTEFVARGTTLNASTKHRVVVYNRGKRTGLPTHGQ